MAKPKSTYSDKLKDHRWQKKRLEILDRDNWSCQICGATDRTLHAHHVHYDNELQNPWEYNNDQIITLCDSCHSIEHECLQMSKDYLLITAITAGFNTSEKIDRLAEMLSIMDMAKYPDNPSNDKERFIEMVKEFWNQG